MATNECCYACIERDETGQWRVKRLVSAGMWGRDFVINAAFDYFICGDELGVYKAAMAMLGNPRTMVYDPEVDKVFSLETLP